MDRSEHSTGPKTLADRGISKDQSSRWQKLADVPDDKIRGRAKWPSQANDIRADRGGPTLKVAHPPRTFPKYGGMPDRLAAAKSFDEVKSILDKAVALAAYARQAKNRDLEADAVEIWTRATLRVDELRRAQKETVGLSTGAQGLGTLDAVRVADKPAPTLASQGIDKNLLT